MGWIESPTYLCAASDTGWDLATKYVETPIGSLPNHKFVDHEVQGGYFETLPNTSVNSAFSYLIKVHVDDYISLAVPTSR